MDKIVEYYKNQSRENLKWMNDTIHLPPPNKTLLPLIYDPDVRGWDSNENVPIKMLVGFLLYLIVFPIFLLCWFSMISLLKRQGVIRSREASTAMEELATLPTRLAQIPKGRNVRI